MRSLEEEITVASELVGKMFPKWGSIPPTCFVFLPDGDVKSLKLDCSSASAKKATMIALRAHLQLVGAVGCIWVTEAWIDAKGDAEQRAAGVGAHGEGVIFSGEDLKRKVIAMRRITRNAKGKPKLGVLDFDPEPPKTGNLVGLMPRMTTEETLKQLRLLRLSVEAEFGEGAWEKAHMTDSIKFASMAAAFARVHGRVPDSEEELEQWLRSDEGKRALPITPAPEIVSLLKNDPRLIAEAMFKAGLPETPKGRKS